MAVLPGVVKITTYIGVSDEDLRFLGGETSGIESDLFRGICAELLEARRRVAAMQDELQAAKAALGRPLGEDDSGHCETLAQAVKGFAAVYEAASEIHATPAEGGVLVPADKWARLLGAIGRAAGEEEEF